MGPLALLVRSPSSEISSAVDTLRRSRTSRNVNPLRSIVTVRFSRITFNIVFSTTTSLPTWLSNAPSYTSSESWLSLPSCPETIHFCKDFSNLSFSRYSLHLSAFVIPCFFFRSNATLAIGCGVITDSTELAGTSTTSLCCTSLSTDEENEELRWIASVRQSSHSSAPSRLVFMLTSAYPHLRRSTAAAPHRIPFAIIFRVFSSPANVYTSPHS